MNPDLHHPVQEGTKAMCISFGRQHLGQVGQPDSGQSLPTLPGSDACGIKHLGVKEVLFPCSPRQFKHLLALCVPKQECQELAPRLALPQLGGELASLKLDATASRKHELKQKFKA